MQDILYQVFGPGSVKETLVAYHPNRAWGEETDWRFEAIANTGARFDHYEAYFVPQNIYLPGYWEEGNNPIVEHSVCLDNERGMHPGHIWGYTMIRFYFKDLRENITVAVEVYPPEMLEKGAFASVDGKPESTKEWYPGISVNFDMLASCPGFLKFTGWTKNGIPSSHYKQWTLNEGPGGGGVYRANFAERTGMPLYGSSGKILFGSNGRILCDA